ncbi:hypothetical protein BHM03_00045798 [Ensete ventricosum]|nr:hypothetical protein BHM03_00045798 [Ensete ventricosum]
MIFHSFVPWIALVPSMHIFLLPYPCIILKYCLKQFQLTTYTAIFIVIDSFLVNLIISYVYLPTSVCVCIYIYKVYN